MTSSEFRYRGTISRKLAVLYLPLFHSITLRRLCGVQWAQYRPGSSLDRSLSPSKSTIKPITPESVKGLMMVEALTAGILGAWLYNDYQYNLNMQAYAKQVFGTNFITYTMIIGIAVGLAGTIVAFTLWNNLRDARTRLEHLSTPKLRSSVRHALSVLPTIDEETPASAPNEPALATNPVNQSSTVITDAATSPVGATQDDKNTPPIPNQPA